jgi:acyl-coenzyme A thioesterase PaaI-like protein
MEPTTRLIVNDEPDNRCFGCSPHNRNGLRLRFLETEPGAVESTYVAPEHLCGAPGVVHGGIQAALLDEVMGVAAHSGAESEDVVLVTAEFHLRYRRPVPTATSLTIRARLARREGNDFFLEGAIVGADGHDLTRAKARWRQLV